MTKSKFLTAQARNEAEILWKMRQYDPDRFNFIRCNDAFMYKQKICFDFEMLHMSLFDFQHERPDRSLTVKEIRPILHQIATALDLLQKEKIVHTDLKPDNIMLVDHVKKPLKIKIIDFGLACHVPEPKLDSGVQPYVYRAPEVILGIPFSSAIDMWSLGCIAAELFLGTLLFPARNEYNMLQLIIQARGQIPQRVLKRGENTRYYFRKKRNRRGGCRRWSLKSHDNYRSLCNHLSVSLFDQKEIQSPKSLNDILTMKSPFHLSDEDTTAELEDQEDFVELLKNMLNLDADKRITPSLLLENPFITMEYQAKNHSNSFYFKSCCDAMEICRDPNWKNHWDHPLISDTALAFSTSLSLHENSQQQEQLSFLSKEEGTSFYSQEPKVEKDVSSRSKGARKRRRFSSEAPLSPNRDTQSSIPAKNLDTDLEEADTVSTGTQTDLSCITVTVNPEGQRSCDASKILHFSGPRSESPVSKKRKVIMDLHESQQAPSEVVSKYNLRYKRKQRIDTERDQGREGSTSPERKRRKSNSTSDSQKSPAVAETSEVVGKSRRKRKRREDLKSPERKSNSTSESQKSPAVAETSEVVDNSRRKRKRREDLKSPERKRNSTSESQKSPAVAETSEVVDNSRRKRKRREDLKSPERKSNSTSESQKSPAVAETSEVVDNSRRKRKRREDLKSPERKSNSTSESQKSPAVAETSEVVDNSRRKRKRSDDSNSPVRKWRKNSHPQDSPTVAPQTANRTHNK
ncbi:serine/threonine-protein kinase BUR1-like [Cyprinodon tularosa]|uniref:serine/threonine-protein kinase BUR1-like n=1 Tax=Cyprinodon tularosa TaxID=77115 RepID=UPI0018E20C44|nr:serine/threonine-protein kinase BUR1-like [Cyprinodon tularosa]